MTVAVHPGDRKLSEIARHLIIPEGIVSTDWPIVERQLRKMNTPLDEWQRGLCKVLVAKRADGQYACGIGGGLLSIPRQTGKTYTIGSLVFALCLANRGTLVIWSAHRSKTHNETFRTMGSMAERPEIAPFVKRVLTGAGTECIEFTNGSRILFGAREGGFGRGFAEVDIVVLDEAQILTEAAMEDMVPATNAAKNGLVLMMGTPPRPKDPGEVFTNRRASALSGEDEDVLYVEFSADEGASPDDRKQWAIANPSFPHRTSETAILRMRKLLGSVESFLREGLGIWDKKQLGRKAFQASEWSKRHGMPPDDGVKVFGVKFSVDGSTVALSAAMKPESGPIHIEGITSAPLSEGTQWLVDFLVERKGDIAQIVIDGKAGVGYLVEALRSERVGKLIIITPTLDQVITSHSMFAQAVTGGGLTHSGQGILDEQAKDAIRRKIGTTGGFGWEGSSEGNQVTLLDAATLAYFGAKITKRNPGRKQAFL